jgi:molecular chaperone IbpA
VEVVTEQNRLSVRGKDADRPAGAYLYRGIARRAFEHVFELADYVTVTGANMADGLLVIDLKRELPEALKPRRIELSAQPIKLESIPRDAAA